VMPWDVCSKWSPNSGLLMLLHRASRVMSQRRPIKSAGE
jgi:hypothetical protein